MNSCDIPLQTKIKCIFNRVSHKNQEKDLILCCLQLQGCQILKHMRKMEIFQDSNTTSNS